MTIIVQANVTEAGVLTLSDLKDEVRYHLGGRTDTDPRLTRFLNLAQSRIARIRDFQEMQQLTQQVFVITASESTDKFISMANLRELYSFRILDDSESIKLKQVSTRQWDTAIPLPEYFARDVPSHYTIWANQCELWPVPDKAYTYIIRWTKWPTPFNDTVLTAVSEFTNKDELLINLAAAYAFDSLGKLSDADRKYKVVGQLFTEAITMDSLKPDLEYAPTREIFDGSVTTSDYWRDPFNISGVVP